ncbi:MAG: hypothetical protein QOG48_563 [Verrucomicrobiota bacterium]|jgi:hypothetical protein
MLVIAALLACICAAASAKPRHCVFRVHAEANQRDTGVFASAVHAQLSGKDVAIEKIPRISEQDVIGFTAYPHGNGDFGALLQLDEHGRLTLDTLSLERRGGYVFIFVNGRVITEMQIDKRVSDGKIYIASGLTNADVALMKKDWRPIGKKRR